MKLGDAGLWGRPQSVSLPCDSPGMSNSAPTPRLNRFFFDLQTSPPLDSSGLLESEDAARKAGALTMLELTEHRLVMVVGPPYSGKSTCIKQLAEQEGRPRLVSDVRDGNVDPQGWGEWRATGGPTTWFIDSLDESDAAPNRVLTLVRTLDAPRRSELSIFVSCRENEVPPTFLGELGNLLGSVVTEVRIAPPDLREARAICGVDETVFSSMLDAIHRNDLRELAEQPAALKWLASQGDSISNQSATKVWQGVIEGILEAAARRPGERLSPLLHRFRAAARLAFFLEFGDFDRVRTSGTNALAQHPSVDALFANNDHGEPGQRLLQPVYEVIRSGLVRPANGGLRIHHRHLREYLAAVQLQELDPLQVEELLGDGDGGLDQGRRRIAEALLDLAPDDRVRQWLASHLLPLQHQQTSTVDGHFTRVLDEVERSPWGLHAHEQVIKQLAALDGSELDRTVSRFARDAKDWSRLTEKQRVFLYSVAERVRTKTLIERAREELESKTDLRSKEDAFEYLTRVGEAPDLPRLARKVSVDKEPRLLAKVLVEALRTGAMSARDALEFGLKRDPFLFDIRALVEVEAGERLTAEEAFWCLETRTSNEHPDIVLDKALSLLGNSAVAEGWAARFIAATKKAKAEGRWQDHRRLFAALAENHELQRQVFALGLRDDRFEDLVRVGMSFTAADLPWLLGKLQQDSSPVLVSRIFHLAKVANDESSLRQLEATCPTQLKNLIEAVTQEQTEMEDFMRRHEKPREQMHLLLDILKTELPKERSATDLVHFLGWVVFGSWRPTNVEGSFDDLPPDMREVVLRRATQALADAEATAIEPGNSISGAILQEASVVDAVIQRNGVNSLAPAVARKWLPALLRSLEKDDSLKKCAEAFPRESADAFGIFIERDAREPDGHAFTATRAPPELWGAGLEQRATTLVEDATLPAIGRAHLLTALLEAVPGTSLELARNLLSRIDTGGELRTASIRVLLALAPNEGVAALRRDANERGRAAVLAQTRVFDSFGARQARLESWNLDDLVVLADVLLDVLPEGTFEEPRSGQAHYVTPEIDLIWTRNSVVSILARRDAPELRAKLNPVASKSPRLQRALQQRDAEGTAEAHVQMMRVVGTGPSAPPPPSGPETSPVQPPRRRSWSYERLLRLLASTEYRLARTTADLARVLVEVFEERINGDVVVDSALLYREDGNGRKPVTEPVLQAYLYRRLEDLMPGRIVDREAWQPFDRAADFQVRVQHDEGLVTVPIELKWSNHPEVRTAASEQLGKKYMMLADRKDGVLVVAWMGKPGGETELKAEVTANAQQFEGQNPSKRIHVAWLRVEPPPEAKPKPHEARTAKGGER